LFADDPKPDPAGTATGVAADVPGFVVTAPADLSADDKKDQDKVKAYADAKKAFDDYTKQAAAEPLAVKLADNVGHNRVSINFVWTLVTGFLVMFMQAGFALVETGLCRAKNSSHTMAMNFMIYPLGMLGFYGSAGREMRNGSVAQRLIRSPLAPSIRKSCCRQIL
jgi:Amt family ammonium transporter